jgi:hypothetical protein
MRCAHTVEHPKGLARRQLRKAVKLRLKLKKKAGFGKFDAASDSEIGL